MAVVSASVEGISLTRHMDPSPSRLESDSASEVYSSANASCAAESPDRSDQFNSSPNPNRDFEIQAAASLRSEEYRQLFRIPPDEVLVQDFNCAFQESILLQGHMYLFVHYVCFYSNIFGFETKKIIPFDEITTVRRAKMAGIFPNAIEIFAGGRKYFFASFLSRDEAFKIINDGWLQHGNSCHTIAEQQDSSSESNSPQNGSVITEKVDSTKDIIAESNSIKRDEDDLSDSKLHFNVENGASTTHLEIPKNNVDQDGGTVLNTESSCLVKIWSWKIENSDAPKIPECYTKVAETKFQMKVEEFFSLFFSDDAVSFIESFHRKCGDKEFTCTTWFPHDKFGHTRDVSFQHPIKLYFGAKFGSCKEFQKFRVYKNSRLVIETSQEVNNVPYGDYFCVEALWDVVRDDNESKECCILRVYVNVAFSKKTFWKGKIVQSTLEECRDAYAIFISMAHDVLKQKNLEKPEGWIVVDSAEGGPAVSTIQNDGVHFQREVNTAEPSDNLIRRVPMTDSLDANQRVDNILEGSLASTASLLRESMTKFCIFVRGQSGVSLILVIAFAVILLMQVSIVGLLNRPQHIHVTPPDYMDGRLGERSAESMAWLEKGMSYLKGEMLMAEARLEKMSHEHAVLKAQLKDLEQLHKPQ